ncbi:hypothetical protein ACIBJI_11035 [Nocardia sp. NPDC050408]|uniref:hypothetical protein n=1 Tax=Nocardia sp. NPDC050408 TaxID=3364319 RepID=UPI00378A2A18
MDRYVVAGARKSQRPLKRIAKDFEISVDCLRMTSAPVSALRDAIALQLPKRTFVHSVSSQTVRIRLARNGLRRSIGSLGACVALT